jgi:hypothetical protein
MFSQFLLLRINSNSIFIRSVVISVSKKVWRPISGKTPHSHAAWRLFCWSWLGDESA